MKNFKIKIGILFMLSGFLLSCGSDDDILAYHGYNDVADGVVEISTVVRAIEDNEAASEVNFNSNLLFLGNLENM
ncbi:MAG: hypothetical protein AAFP76_11220 [Bacteroidota bacterium]